VVYGEAGAYYTRGIQSSHLWLSGTLPTDLYTLLRRRAEDVLPLAFSYSGANREN